MKIALIGYGKMGQAIEAMATQSGHQVVLKIHADNRQHFTDQNLQNVDVAIEFTGPHSAAENISRCLQSNVPVICGSTGWLHDFPAIETAVYQQQGAFLYASNYSIGVNIFFEINTLLSKLMSGQINYQPQITEVHHTEKKDAPSGTAITLAEQIMVHNVALNKWVLQPNHQPNELLINSIRQNPEPGTHTVQWTSAIDDIEIKHTAHNRHGFALGAVLAAEFIIGKKGIFTMKDVLGL